MKRIALLAVGWKRLITYEWISGLKKYCENIDEPVKFDHFNCMGSWSDDPAYNEGEYNIFELININEYDGIILDINNIRTSEHLNLVMNKVRNASVPVISLGHYIDGCYYVSINNEAGIRKMMDHLYEKHDCKKFVFVGGPKSSKENQIRIESYKNFFERKGLEYDADSVYCGTFEMTYGHEFFDEFCGSEKILPDAFICANDNIAAGLINSAQEKGYTVPDDFRVTGFDNLDKAYCFNPQISSVPHRRFDMGEECMKIFESVWNGQNTEKVHLVDALPVFTESCGCELATKIDFRQYVKENVINSEKKRAFEEKLLNLEKALLASDSFEEVYTAVGEYFSEMDCDGVSLVMDKRLAKLADEDQFLVEGYDLDNLEVVYCSYNTDKLKISEYPELVEYIKNNSDSGEEVYMYSPFHFKNHSIGFSILRNGHFLYDNPHFFDIQSLVNREIRRIYQEKQLKKVNRELEELYRLDALTGLYNRRAYFEMVNPLLNECKIIGKKCLIAFFDCNNFKKINDELGHDQGDEILKKIGVALKASCRGKGLPFRFGGDEFILVNPCSKKSESEEILRSVQDELAKDDISVSIGSVLVEEDSNMSLEEYVKIADQEMYKAKRLFKEKNKA